MDALNLKFDNMKVNINQAEEFLKKNNEFIPLVNIEDADFVTTRHCDKFGSIIHVIDLHNEDEKQVSTSVFSDKLLGRFQVLTRPHEDLMEKFRLLAAKIEENIDLITQLEYLTRSISINDAKANVLLIIQNLIHWSTEITKKSVDSRFLILGAETPLLFLGFVTHILLSFEHVVIVSSDKTAAVCHLFTKLCHEAGLDNVNLAFIKDLGDIRDLDTICIGVITEKSDMDSAVDVLLTSTNAAPWKLRRILVQESIYDQFKDILIWKTNLRSVNSNNQDTADLKTKCSNVFTYDEKLLLLDYVDPEVKSPFDQQIILIEAYRTTKEAMSLIKFYKAFYVSLWSSDISEANEIAYGTDVQIVWINDFANFSGPSEVSRAIYSKLDRRFSSRKIKKTNAVLDLCKLLDSWLKLNVGKRREIISKALKSFMSDSAVTLEIKKLVKDIKDALIKPIDTFVAVSDNYMCVGLNKPVGVVVSDHNYMQLIMSVVKGNGVIFVKKEYSELIEHLKNAGVPVVTSEVSLKGNFKVAFDCLYQTKVVWTNFGTVYAN